MHAILKDLNPRHQDIIKIRNWSRFKHKNKKPRHGNLEFNLKSSSRFSHDSTLLHVYISWLDCVVMATLKERGHWFGSMHRGHLLEWWTARSQISKQSRVPSLYHIHTVVCAQQGLRSIFLRKDWSPCISNLPTCAVLALLIYGHWGAPLTWEHIGLV